MQLDIATSMEEVERRKVDYYWAARIGHILAKSYPGHGWQVEVDTANGVANIFNAHMNPIMGYRLKLKEVHLPTLDQQIIRIGGEVLERFGLSRERFDADAVRQKQSDAIAPGRVKADMS